MGKSKFRILAFVISLVMSMLTVKLTIIPTSMLFTVITSLGSLAYLLETLIYWDK